MKKYGYCWQIWTGAAFLLLLWMTVFLPGFSINADKYADSAVEANRHALESNSELTSAQKVIDEYAQSYTGREELGKKIEEKSILRLFLARWALTADQSIESDLVRQNEGLELRTSGIKIPLRLWGWMIFLPFLFSMITIVFMLSMRRIFAWAILTNGIMAIICECIGRFLVPSMLWEKAGGAIRSMELVSEEVLDQYGAGEVMVKSLFARGSGSAWAIVLVLGVILSIFGILCMTVWRPKVQVPSVTGDPGSIAGKVPEVWNRHQKNIPAYARGEIIGLHGEYQGQKITIPIGEEIIIGRDPQYSMLVLSNPKISRRQCGIRYDAQSGYYYAIDYSSGGTQLPDGTLLATSEYTMLPPGSGLYMAKGAEAFLVM